MSASSAAHIDESGQVIMGRRDKKRKLSTTAEPMNQTKRLVVVLEAACLETVKCTSVLTFFQNLFCRFFHSLHTFDV